VTKVQDASFSPTKLGCLEVGASAYVDQAEYQSSHKRRVIDLE
jgi:hypothetical protein